MNPQGRFRGDHGGANIEGCSFPLGNPVLIQEYQLFHGIHEQVRVHRGHAHSLRGQIHPCNVFRRPEKVNLTVSSPVSFQAFEDFLSVMETHGGRIEGD